MHTSLIFEHHKCPETRLSLASSASYKNSL